MERKKNWGQCTELLLCLFWHCKGRAPGALLDEYKVRSSSSSTRIIIIKKRQKEEEGGEGGMRMKCKVRGGAGSGIGTGRIPQVPCTQFLSFSFILGRMLLSEREELVCSLPVIITLRLCKKTISVCKQQTSSHTHR